LAFPLLLAEHPCLMATSITLKNGEQVKINGNYPSFLPPLRSSNLIQFISHFCPFFKICHPTN
jgi:hypothetical protein